MDDDDDASHWEEYATHPSTQQERELQKARELQQQHDERREQEEQQAAALQRQRDQWEAAQPVSRPASVPAQQPQQIQWPRDQTRKNKLETVMLELLRTKNFMDNKSKASKEIGPILNTLFPELGKAPGQQTLENRSLALISRFKAADGTFSLEPVETGGEPQGEGADELKRECRMFSGYMRQINAEKLLSVAEKAKLVAAREHEVEVEESFLGTIEEDDVMLSAFRSARSARGSQRGARESVVRAQSGVAQNLGEGGAPDPEEDSLASPRSRRRTSTEMRNHFSEGGGTIVPPNPPTTGLSGEDNAFFQSLVQKSSEAQAAAVATAVATAVAAVMERLGPTAAPAAVPPVQAASQLTTTLNELKQIKDASDAGLLTVKEYTALKDAIMRKQTGSA
jgi:hypothetical protein